MSARAECSTKQSFATVHAAQRAIRDRIRKRRKLGDREAGRRICLYRCPVCRQWHLGHSRWDVQRGRPGARIPVLPAHQARRPGTLELEDGGDA